MWKPVDADYVDQPILGHKTIFFLIPEECVEAPRKQEETVKNEDKKQPHQIAHFDITYLTQTFSTQSGLVAECGQPGQTKLSCSMVHEQCSEAELCISKEKILSCHQLFQCGYTSVMPSTLRNTYQPSEGRDFN